VHWDIGQERSGRLKSGPPLERDGAWPRCALPQTLRAPAPFIAAEAQRDFLKGGTVAIVGGGKYGRRQS
jgi:hypothetical protein